MRFLSFIFIMSTIFGQPICISNTKELLTPIISKVYYINLPHRQDRNSEFLENFNHKDILTNRIERIEADLTPENGAIGCLTSHIKALKKAKSDNVDVAFIAEDDLYIETMNLLNEYVITVNDNFYDWNMMMIGHSTHDFNKTDVVFNKEYKIQKIKYAITSSGYVINKDYIIVLLNLFEKHYNIYQKEYETHNDPTKFYHWVDRIWDILQDKDNWYSSEPRIARQRKSYSDIENRVTEYGV